MGLFMQHAQNEWFVEIGFIAAASMTRPENIVCVKVHSMEFLRPVQKGGAKA